MKHWKKILMAIGLVVATSLASCEVVVNSTTPTTSQKTDYEVKKEKAQEDLELSASYISFTDNEILSSDKEVIAKVVRDDFTAVVTYESNSSYLTVQEPASGALTLKLKVTRPAAEYESEFALVNLKATVKVTFSYLDGTETKTETLETVKTFNVRIPRQLPVAKLTIADIIAAPVDAKELTVEGTVYSVMFLINATDDTKSTYSGFYIYDETGSIYIYSGNNKKDIKVGDKVVIKGQKALYYGMPQITKTGASGTPTADITILSSGNPITMPAVKNVTIDDLSKEDQNTSKKYANLYELYAKVSVEGANTYLVDPYTGAKVQIYFTSNGIPSVNAFNGKFVNIKVPLYGYNQLWRVSYSDFEGSLVEASAPELTPAQKVDAAKNYLTANLNNKDFFEYSPMNLIASVTDFGATVTYELSAASQEKVEIISTQIKVKDGMDLTANVPVVVTATIVVGDVNGTVDINLTAKPLDVSTVAQAVVATKGTFVNVEGIVVGGNTGSLYLKDDTGIILVYKAMDKLNQPLVIGDKATIRGTADNFNGTPQIASPVVLRKISSGNDLGLVATSMTAAELVGITLENLPSKINTYVEIPVTIKVSGNYVNAVNPNSATLDIQIYNLSAADTTTLKAYDGQVVTLKAIIYGNSKADLTGNWRLVYLSHETNIQLTELGVAANLTVTGTVGSWDAVTGANGYTVDILQGTTVTKTVDVTTNSIDLSKQGLVTGSYTFKVTAKPGAGYTASTQQSPTKDFDYTKVEEPVGEHSLYKLDLSKASALTYTSKAEGAYYSYSTAYTIKINDGKQEMEWNVLGFNPNEWAVAGVRFGGKNTQPKLSTLTNIPAAATNTNLEAVYAVSKSTVTGKVNKVIITTLDKFGSPTLENVYVQASTSADFSAGVVDVGNSAIVVNNQIVVNSSTALENMYFRVIFGQSTTGTSNVGIIVASVDFINVP